MRLNPQPVSSSYIARLELTLVYRGAVSHDCGTVPLFIVRLLRDLSIESLPQHWEAICQHRWNRQSRADRPPRLVDHGKERL